MMEVFLCDSNICRLCGEENDHGTFLYSFEENNKSLSEIINTYLPIKVRDDGQLPRTICPGCTIQLEATVEFLALIVNGQNIIRELHMKEIEYKKNSKKPNSKQNYIKEHVIYKEDVIYKENPASDDVYPVDHPIALQAAIHVEPKRKRGRPPKIKKSPEELAKEAAAKEREMLTNKKKKQVKEVPSGKRRRKTPTRYKEAVQGKELERILQEEGVTDGEESDKDIKSNVNVEAPKVPEIIGHAENSGELILLVKGKGRGRPKGPMHPISYECAICGLKDSCAGRYMSHIAQHGPVIFQCAECNEEFDTHLNFINHQKELSHTGKNIMPVDEHTENIRITGKTEVKTRSQAAIQPSVTETPDVSVNTDNEMTSLPDLSAQPITDKPDDTLMCTAGTASDVCPDPAAETVVILDDVTSDIEKVAMKSDEVKQTKVGRKKKMNIKCNHCDKIFSNRQSKSLHIKAAHQGERPFVCAECGARFAYPRSLALHALSHRRHRKSSHRPKGYACDLCGKVLSHPSSVVYHKQAEHAGQKYVCSKCGKSFKHKQLLKRHQLVHSQLRPYTCKLCNSSFKTKVNLINHQSLHTGVKKHSCEICKNKFAHKTSLKLHMRWHTGQKPYACGTCGKSFTQKGNLAEHERIHTGEKPFQCAVCNRRFTTSSQHRLHLLRRHGPDKAYLTNGPGPHVTNGVHRVTPQIRNQRCTQCGRMFKERLALLKHLRFHASDTNNKANKKISLLASSQPQEQQEIEKKVMVPTTSTADVDLPTVESQEDAVEEGVIYVTYNVDTPNSPAFQILSPQQAESLDDNKVLTTCQLYSGSSLLVPQPQLDHLELEQDDMEPLVLDEQEHMPVTDEHGNPLHFTMQDGTRLAITSVDGKSLQVITQDGQTIPVEINGYDDDEEIENSDTIVHQLNLQKSDEDDVSTAVTHYFTIV